MGFDDSTHDHLTITSGDGVGDARERILSRPICVALREENPSRATRISNRCYNTYGVPGFRLRLKRKLSITFRTQYGSAVEKLGERGQR